MNAKIYLHPHKEAALMRGHPWIYPKAIAKSMRCVTGELVNIYDAQNNLLAIGVYNEHSLYRVRVLSRDTTTLLSLPDLITAQLKQAKQLREILNLPQPLTNAYRLFNSEADGLSGLTIDRFNQTCVVSSSAFWVEAHQLLIMDCLQALFPTDEVIWFSQAKLLAQEGWQGPLSLPKTKTERVLEAGIIYDIDFSHTQKTGLFLDQRENHQRLGALAQGKRVLDLYTYTGGFALHAAKQGAAHVTAVDSSEQAIQLAKQNAALNKLDNIEFVTADARHYLSRTGEYDIVILDPPKLVPSVKHIERAKNYYRYLHRETFKHMRSGTLLMTCNCSAALSTQQFTELVGMQALMVNKTARILGVYGPSLCHPTLASFPEGNYLTAVLLAIF